ncbi:MAG: hypothetical protein LAQ69_15190 [Acidobacteriia bacterium]|nr:hypothetical protein [Terriglobia bacterium]
MPKISLNRHEIAGLLAAARSIVAAHAEELPKDEIKQWELAALYHLNTAQNALALSFARRTEAGATMEVGEYVLDLPLSDTEEVIEIAEECAGMTSHDVSIGLSIEWNPREVEPEKAA